MRGILVKYCKRKYAESFKEDGIVHFERLKTFIEQEDKYGEHVIADELEGALFRKPDPKKSRITITDSNGKRFILPEEKVQYNFTDYDVEKWGVCSFTFLDFERDFEIIEQNEKNAVLRIKPSVCEELRVLSLNGTRIPLIIGPGAFSRHVSKYFSAKKEPSRWGMVRYYSLDTRENMGLADYQNDPGKIIFYKSNEFAYEREYRVGIVHPISKMGKNIVLGNLSDCARYLDRHELLNDLRFTMLNNN
ncbi:hypothetical protein [Levilactobacillus brevis]|uniref:hypothetical protein n=1 Tax=Levilactobacillus brevis TaxID=1580 RepID=UPI0035A35631